MKASSISKFHLPVQVAAICFRRGRRGVEFLLVNTNGGKKWTFPKGAPQPHLSHSQSAEVEALEEAGVRGVTEARHFHLYIHSKGVFWQPGGVKEYVVKAFLLEVQQMRRPHELARNPTWFSSDEAKRVLGQGREVKYGLELQAVIDRALERLAFAEHAEDNGDRRVRRRKLPAMT